VSGFSRTFAALSCDSVLRRCMLFVLIMMLSAGAGSALDASQAAVAVRCELPEATLLLRQDNSVLQVWELPVSPAWFGENLPDTTGYLAYRAAIRAAGADQARPVSDPPQPKDDAERELWRREYRNVALMYEGGGEVRRIQCLEAALFALQDARYSQLTRPTEFAAHILRRDDRLKVYLGASDQLFPPKRFYGLEEVAADVAAGWQYWVVLHNHPLAALAGRPALGVPAPSTSDVELFRGLAARLGLREVWVTNGMYTGTVPSEKLLQFSTRE
jgi:hypothetical protein